MIQQRQADLLDLALALVAVGRFPRRLHGRQQQRDEDADDGNHHQQFDKGESAPSPRWG